jgi:hypothetical protein
MHTRLSCKIDYLLRSNHRDLSFTDDFLVAGAGVSALPGLRHFHR